MLYLIQNNDKLLGSRKGKLQVIEGRKAVRPPKFFGGEAGCRST